MFYVTFGEEGYIDFGKRTTRESFKVEAEEKLIQRVGNDTPVIDYMDESLNASGISASTLRRSMQLPSTAMVVRECTFFSKRKSNFEAENVEISLWREQTRARFRRSRGILYSLEHELRVVTA